MIRRGTSADAEPACALLLRARAAAAADGAIPPSVHAPDDVRAWFAAEVAGGGGLWLAEAEGGGLAGLLVLARSDGEDWVDQLYVEPGLTGRGVGAALLGTAKRERPGGLRLWVFRSNTGAQRFYRRHGFTEVRRTDGSENEERAPDALYVWPGLAATPGEVAR